MKGEGEVGGAPEASGRNAVSELEGRLAAPRRNAVSAVAEDTPDLLYSDAERALADSLRSLLADQGGLDKALARTESGQTYDDGLWTSVATDLGCAGLLIPERDGGAGASYREAAAAAEALGSFVAPVPYLGSAVVATAALLSVASGAPHSVAAGPSASSATPFTSARVASDLLRRMADGGVTVALATSFATPPGAGFPGSVRVAGPRPGEWPGCGEWSAGSPTRCPPACCSFRPTACRTGCTWSTCRLPAWPRRPWCRWT